VADIDATAEETVLSCPATGVTVSIEFDAPISSASSSSSSPGMSSGAVITGNRCRVCYSRLFVWWRGEPHRASVMTTGMCTGLVGWSPFKLAQDLFTRLYRALLYPTTSRVTFTADNLEGNPTQFSVALEECGNVTSVDYEDDQGNSPDFSRLPSPACVEVSDTKVTAPWTLGSLGIGIFLATFPSTMWPRLRLDRAILLPGGRRRRMAQNGERAREVAETAPRHVPAF